MDPIPHALLVLGGLLFVGLLAEGLARRTRLPQVTLLLLMGVMAGPQALDLLSPERDMWFPVAASLALVMVGFLLGGEFTPDRLGKEAGSIAVVAGVQALITALVVGGGLLLLGFSPQLALPLAGIATATAPATTVSVVRELGAEGPVTRMLLGVVAIDDALALVAFGVLLAVVSVVSGNGGGAGALLSVTREIGGAVGIGIGIGVLAALFSGRIRPGEPTLLEALGVVLVCAGLSLWLEVSYLLAAVVTGSVIANTAKHHSRPFHAIENIEWPFLVVFFLLAGASLDSSVILEIGVLGGAYVLFRVVGKVVGTAAGGVLAGAPETTSRWLGLALLPQAGVALGFALLAAERLPEVADRILSVTILGTVIFELFGPVLTSAVLTKSGETNPQLSPPSASLD